MGNTVTAAGIIRRSLDDQDRTVAWLARRTGIPYKRVLNQVKHESRPLELTTATAASIALGIDMNEITDRAYSKEEAAE